MRHAIAIQPVGRVNIRPTKKGIAITIPNRKDEVIESGQKKMGSGVLAFFCLWLMLWTLGGIFSIKQLWAGALSEDAEEFLGTWLIGWAVGETLVGKILAKAFFGAEKIAITAMDMRIGDTILGFGKSIRYDLAEVTDLRLAGKNATQGKIQFNYGTQMIFCGKHLKAAEAKQLLHHLSAVQTLRCHIVERIVFGASPSPVQEAPTTLYNPDVTDLTFPFVRLQELIIDAATHDFHQVERFVTYAVNYIGQEYLKEQVAVHIYGDPAQLHENLRNSFCNLCKGVHMDEYAGISPTNRQTSRHGDKTRD